MKGIFALRLPGLRLKLVLSYLIVALGAILILAIAIFLAIQNYFAGAQKDQLHAQTEYLAEQIGHLYRARGEDWSAVPLQYIQTSDPNLLIISDQNGAPLLQRGPASLTISEKKSEPLLQLDKSNQDFLNTYF